MNPTRASASATKRNARPQRASRSMAAAVEALEARRLLAGDLVTVQAVPYILNFDKARKGVIDADGQGTGFSFVQPNKNGDEYRPGNLDLRVSSKTLSIKTTGSSSNGSNYGQDNTQTNVLGTQFNGSAATFAVTTTLRGPLDYLNERFEQAGVYFGPDQDNYVKLVVGVGAAGTGLQFVAETKPASTITFPIGGNGSFASIGSLGAVSTLQLSLVGNPSSGKVQAFYQVNEGPVKKFGTELTLSGASKNAFFTSTSRGGILASHKNNSGGITATFSRFAVTNDIPQVSQPAILAVRPGAGQTNVSRDIFVAADVFLPTTGSGVDDGSFSSDSVRLERVSDGAIVDATLNTSGGGDAVVLQPNQPLAANTDYRFVVTAALKDVTGTSFAPFTSTFRTGTGITVADPNIAFEKIALPSAQGRVFSGVQLGPDGRLYATTLTGEIARWDIDVATGRLGEIEIIDSVVDAHGGNRFVTGIVFDPSSTARNLIAWVTHSIYAFEGAADFTGGIARLTGDRLQSYREMITGLPRSIRDHTTNQPIFGSDGKLYFTQGAMSAMGAADPTWGNRAEHLLSAAVLKLDTAAVVARRENGRGPLNVNTQGSAGYDPFATGAPLQIHATGVRSVYDLLLHSNGNLYAPANGSAAGGNVPAGGGAPGLSRVNTTQSDYLFNIVSGRYYGHPNPTRGEFVLNGGNPTSGVDPAEVSQYPVGTQPARNYGGVAFDFGRNVSPNGIIEYQSNSFKSRLKGKILVTRYSGGDDIIALSLDSQGRVSGSQRGIVGLTHFVDPLDLVEDPRSGSLYVVEFGGEKITLVRPVTPGANLTPGSPRLLFNDIRGDGKSTTETLTIRNTGSAPLLLDTNAFTITGGAKARFSVVNRPSLPLTIPVEGSIDITVGFNATGSTSLDPKSATLEIRSNDPDQERFNIRLRGLATRGVGEANEPSLQRVLDLHEIPINVGDADPNSTFLNPPQQPNDEVTAQRFLKAGGGAVTIEPIAMFGVVSNPALRFGYYEPGTGGNATELFTVNGNDAQSVNVFAQGSTTFDPGTNTPFALYGLFPRFTNTDGSVRVVYQEDSLNSWESLAANRRKLRFYPMRNPDGTAVPNAFVFAFEEFTRDYDQQDFVGIIRNVKLAPSGPELGIENLDRAPFYNRLVFNRIENLDANVPNAVHDMATVRIRNTGDQNLSITSTGISGGWQIVSGGGAGTIAPGGFRDLTIRFTVTGGAAYEGNLTINSNDPDEPVRRVSLGGFWQSDSESDPRGRSQEPTLAEIFSVFGYATAATFGTQSIDTGGNIARVGDEVLSSFWVRADGSQPVRVRQLAAFHMQGSTATISYFQRNATSVVPIVTSAGVDGQSFLPRKNNQLSAPATGSFALATSTPFGFRVDNVWSEQSRNDLSRGGEGHYMRFYPVVDRNGQFVENTWLMAMDYDRILPDYQDNVYLIENMAPFGTPTPPDGLNGLRSGNRILLDWADNPERAVIGYNVFRSLSPTSGYQQRNSVLVSSSNYTESTGFAQGTRVYYRVSAVTSDGKESIPASVVVVV